LGEGQEWGAVEVEFRTRHLQRCAANRAEAVRRWGPRVADRYLQRLDLLRAADSLAELGGSRSLHLHPLKGERDGDWALNLTERWRLIIQQTDRGSVIVEEVTNHYE
jgi:toxin HigB-1